jgi:hypothetical protein
MAGPLERMQQIADISLCLPTLFMSNHVVGQELQKRTHTR